MSNAVDKAREVLDLYWDRKVPVDLDKIAGALGVQVKYTYPIDDNPDVSGKLSFDLFSQLPICEINRFDISQRQRFTLAHELGHYLLGHGEQLDTNTKLYRNTNTSQSYEEMQANSFAAEIVMPEIAVDYFIREKNITTIEALALSFDVSEVAMKYRLKNLGWI